MAGGWQHRRQPEPRAAHLRDGINRQAGTCRDRASGTRARRGETHRPARVPARRRDGCESLFKRHRPDVVIHWPAWTRSSTAPRSSALAMRRNGSAVGKLAIACAGAGARLILISTNEVFDGDRQDGNGYAEWDEPRPINAYGESKLAGERAATTAFDGVGKPGDLLIVRTAWLFGPPGNDFPTKIVSAADRLPAGEPLKVGATRSGRLRLLRTLPMRLSNCSWIRVVRYVSPRQRGWRIAPGSRQPGADLVPPSNGDGRHQQRGLRASIAPTGVERACQHASRGGRGDPSAVARRSGRLPAFDVLVLSESRDDF